jgi:hypothetical protein
MKERPIIFSGPMARAILDGRKTQTRRVVKPQPPSIEAVKAKSGSDYGWYREPKNGHLPFRPVGPVWAVRDLDANVVSKGLTCPYGVVGDQLWCRETWTPDHAAFYPNFPVVYKADSAYDYERENGKVYSDEQKAWYPYRWRSPFHMPRRLSRITLEITGVRVERLQAISEADAMAEGMDAKPEPDLSLNRGRFALLWESINGPGSWDANPWVWVIEFKLLSGAST